MRTKCKIPWTGLYITYYILGIRGIPVLEKYRYILYFKRYDIIILLNSVFHTLQLRGGSASQIAAQPVNVTTEQHDGSNWWNYQRTRN